MTIRCPKCRALGLGTDCTDQLDHARKANDMIHDEDDTYLDVTMTFTVPALTTIPMDPVETATYFRELWMGNDSQFLAILAEALDGEYDLQVTPISVL